MPHNFHTVVQVLQGSVSNEETETWEICTTCCEDLFLCQMKALAKCPDVPYFKYFTLKFLFVIGRMLPLNGIS